MNIKKIDGLRGWACIVVLISHLSLVFFPQLHAFSNEKTFTIPIFSNIHNSPFCFFFSGTAAVYCFFVLSGFVLFKSYINKKINILNFINLVIKRYIRLAIPATTSCVVAFILFSIHINNNNITEWGTNIGKVNLNIFSSIYNGAISPFMKGVSSYNWVLWTMKIEFIGSLGILVICFFSNYKKIKVITLISIILFFLLISIFITKSTSYLGYICFLVGVYLYLKKFTLSKIVSFFLLLIGLYFAGVHNGSLSYSFINYLLKDNTYDILNFLGGILITTSIINSDVFDNFFSNKISVFIGKLSFSIYLTHLSVIYIVAIPVFNLLLKKHDFLFSALVSSLIVFIVTFIVSFFFHKFIDEVAIKLSKKITLFQQ